jgi:hypothetical protein
MINQVDDGEDETDAEELISDGQAALVGEGVLDVGLEDVAAAKLGHGMLGPELGVRGDRVKSLEIVAGHGA